MGVYLLKWEMSDSENGTISKSRDVSLKVHRISENGDESLKIGVHLCKWSVCVWKQRCVPENGGVRLWKWGCMSGNRDAFLKIGMHF